MKINSKIWTYSLLLIFVVGIIFNSNAQNDSIPNTQTSISFPDENLNSFVQSAKSIETFHFKINNGKTIKSTSENNVAGYQIAKSQPRLSSHHNQKIKQILSSSDSYTQDDILPKCGFHPDLGFRLINEDEDEMMTVLFMAIPECNVVQIEFKDTIYMREVPSLRTELISFARRYFPREYTNVPIEIEIELPTIPEPIVENPTSPSGDDIVLTSKNPNFYIIQEEDTNWKKVAKKNNTTVRKLKKMNSHLNIKKSKKPKKGRKVRVIPKSKKKKS